MQRAALLFLLVALGAGSGASAQTQPAPQDAQPGDAQTTKPRDLTVAPDSPEKTPESKKADNPGHGAQGAVGPANVCADLVAFFEKKAASPPDAAKPAPEGAKDAKSGTQTAGPGQTAPPMDRAQQRSGISAPIPQDDTSSGSSQVTIEKARTLSQANDLRGCQGAVQQMRRAGMALPPGLLALAALREDLLAKSQPPAGQQPTAQQPPASSQAPNAPPPPSGQGAPAPQGPGAQ
jgi:hypothetical protein